MMIGLLAFLLSADRAAPPPPPTPTDAPPLGSMRFDNFDGLQLICFSVRSTLGRSTVGRQQAESISRPAMPASQMPHGLPKTSHAKPKWVPISDLQVTDDDLSGSLPKGMIEHQDLRIDRITRLMAIGSRNPKFVGNRETYDQTVAHRSF